MTEYPGYPHGNCLVGQHCVNRCYASCACKPQMPGLALLYWSSSPIANNNNNAWNVNFNNGNVNNNNKNNNNHVRLVRGSES
jgi:hypothetical protein